MAQQVHRVHPALQTYVAQCVGYDYLPDPRAVHHGLPSPTATLVIAFDDPLDTEWLGDPRSRARRWTTVSGLGVRPALIHTHGIQRGIQLDLTPAGVGALLGMPVAAIADSLHTLADLGLGDELHERLASAVSWPDRFALLDGLLLAQLHTDPVGPPPEVTHAWDLISRSRGRLRVSVVADRAGWSRRHLQTRFGAEYGVSPKQAARLFRFHYARSLALRGRPLAAIAHQAGYADQAHLTRDWHELAGASPVATLREMFPILQDEAVDARAG